jgi:hypothetical protein
LGPDALAVQLEKAGEDLVADLVWPAVAPRLTPATGFCFVVCIVEDEFALRMDVGPSAGEEDGAIHRVVELA